MRTAYRDDTGFEGNVFRVGIDSLAEEIGQAQHDNDYHHHQGEIE